MLLFLVKTNKQLQIIVKLLLYTNRLEGSVEVT